MWVLMLLIVQGFNIVPSALFNKINGNQQEILVVLVIVIYFVLHDKLKIRITRTDYFAKLIIAFVGYYFLELFVSSIRNGQGILNAFIASNFYLTILIYFICLDFYAQKGRDSFYKILIIFSCIKVALCWLQYILAFKGIYFMSEGVMAIRFGTIRLYNMGDTFNCLGIIVAFAYLVGDKKHDKNRYVYILLCVFGFLGMLLISKGRLQLLALCAGVYSVIYSKNKKKKKMLLYLVLLMIALAVFLQSSIGKTYIESISNPDTDTLGIRSREIAYYNNQTKEHLLLGVGFIRDNGDKMSDYLKGPAHQYSRTDVGLVGVANALGLVGAAWYVTVTFLMLKRLKKIKQQLPDDEYRILLGFVVNSIFCIPTVIWFNPYGVTAFGILMSLIESRYRELMKNRISQG